MQEEIYYCPICKGKVMSTMTETLSVASGLSSRLAPGETLYCPSCEMLVEPIVGSVLTTPALVYLGRSRAGGSNAGGSQRGDISDEGASQWCQNPNEGERNTWHDKG